MTAPALRWSSLAAMSGASAACLHALGQGALAVPPMRSWSSLSAWYSQSGPPVATFALVRTVALATALWVCAAALLQLLSLVLRQRLLLSLVDRVTPVAMRHLVHGVAGMSLSAGVVLPAGGPELPAAEPNAEPTDATATMRPLDVTQAPGPAPPAEPAPVEPAAVESEPDTYHVEPGSHLWAIAEEVLADSLGRQPSEREVRAHWLRLIEANRDRLVVPTNPDLIYAGQVLLLPAVLEP